MIVLLGLKPQNKRRTCKPSAEADGKAENKGNPETNFPAEADGKVEAFCKNEAYGNYNGITP